MARPFWVPGRRQATHARRLATRDSRLATGDRRPATERQGDRRPATGGRGADGAQMNRKNDEPVNFAAYGSVAGFKLRP